MHTHVHTYTYVHIPVYLWPSDYQCICLCFVLYCIVLFCFVLFCFILFGVRLPLPTMYLLSHAYVHTPSYVHAHTFFTHFLVRGHIGAIHARAPAHWNYLTTIATHSNSMQLTATYCYWEVFISECLPYLLQHIETHCNYQITAYPCISLQHSGGDIRAFAATRCNTLQYTATHCNTL